MAAATLFAQPFWYAQDDNGVPLVGAKLTVFEAGSGGAIPLDVFTDPDLEVPWAQPIVTNAAGQSDGPIFMQDASYLLVATDADDNPLSGYPMDNWTTYFVEQP